jgi:hypothetical protein
MLKFHEWLSSINLADRLWLETFYTFNPIQINQVFRDELGKVVQRTSDPAQRQSLERLDSFDWISYVAGASRRVFRDYRQGQEVISDVASKLLLGKLFRGFVVPQSSVEDAGDYLLARFKRSVANCLRNMTEKERNRRRFIPTTPIRQDFEPGGITADNLAARSAPAHDDQNLIQGFRELLRNRLGALAVAVFDLRMAGGETKSLVGSPSVGSPGKYVVKRVVREIKDLAREFAHRLDDPAFLRDVERAMDRESATISRRSQTTAARQAG